MKSYDLKTRDGKQTFYHSREWSYIRSVKLNKDTLCEECLKKGRYVPATDVHHLIDIDDCPTYDNALDIDNLESLCKQCHSTITINRSTLRHKKIKDKKFNVKDFKKHLGIE